MPFFSYCALRYGQIDKLKFSLLTFHLGTKKTTPAVPWMKEKNILWPWRLKCCPRASEHFRNTAFPTVTTSDEGLYVQIELSTSACQLVCLPLLTVTMIYSPSWDERSADYAAQGANLHNFGAMVTDAAIRNRQNLHLLKWKKEKLEYCTEVLS